MPKMEELGENVCSGLDSVKIKIIRKIDEFKQEGNFFKPDMCHQVFGQSESIYGYKNLKIEIIYEACQFWCYVRSSYESKLEPDPVSGLQPENYMKKMIPWLPKDYITDEKDFLKRLEEEKSGPKGQLVSSFSLVDGRQFQVRVTDVDTVGYADFHQRMETLIVWFIDAANFIDMDDKKWRFYILYERVAKNEFEYHYYPVGYSTVYEYYAFPEHRRYRISQFIVFPAHQQLGLGAQLLRAIYQQLGTLPNILDITVEDPSDRFQRLRDYVDATLCQQLPAFKSAELRCDFSKRMVNEARSQLRLTEKQVRRIYEILRLAEAETDDQYHAFKRTVKHRLNIPYKGVKTMKRFREKMCAHYKKQERNSKRQKLVHGSQSEGSETHSADQHEGTIDKEFQKLLVQYRHVLDRLRRDQQ